MIEHQKLQSSFPSWSSILVAVAVLLALIPAETRSDDSITLRRLSSFISLATGYLTRVSHTALQDPRQPGVFTYSVYLDEDLPLNFVNTTQQKYNLLRHNGAIYSLALLYKRSRSEEILTTIERAVQFVKDNAIAPVPDANAQITDDDHVYSKIPHIPNMLAAWENKAITGYRRKTLTAKLGGAGLALVALCSLEQITPGSTSIEYMRQIAEFIRFLQKEDGSFVCTYIPKKGGKDESWVSLFYPGEAALGLLCLASIETNEVYKKQWINVATKTLLYLEQLRRPQKLREVEADHWALIATAKLLPMLDPKSSDYSLVYQHAIKVLHSMTTNQSRESLIKNKGCHSKDTRTCPTSARLEGLLAGLSFVRPDELITVYNKTKNLRDRMLFFIHHGAKFLLDAQEVKSSHNMQGGMPAKYPATKERDSMEVRVDYVQHAVSAMVAYETFLLDKNKSSVERFLAHPYSILTMSWVAFGLILFALSGRTATKIVRRRKKSRLQVQ